MENKDKNLFDKDRLLFRQMFLLTGDTEAIERDSKGDRLGQKLKVRPNLLSIYAMVVTLLLVLSANNSMANNKQVAVESDLIQLASLERQLEQSQARMLAIESSLIPIVEKAISIELPQAEVTAVKTDIPQVKNKPSAIVNQLPESQLPILPVPVLPPPPFFQSSPSFPALPIPQPAKPSTDLSALTPLPIVEVEPKVQLPTQSLAEDKVEPKLDAGQWLGHTDAVYYSSSFEQSEKQSQINIASSEAINKKLDGSLALFMPSNEVAEPKYSLVTKPSLSLVNAEKPNLLAKAEPQINSVTESKPLFSDEDLSIYLSSTPLLDERTVRQRLGTPASVAQLQSSKATNNETIKIDSQEIAVTEAIAATADKAVEAIEKSITAKLEDNSLTNGLFSDEDLTRYLSSAPLLDDSTIQHKLGTASTVAQLQSLDTTDTEVLEVDLSKIVESEEIASVAADEPVEESKENVIAKLEDESLSYGLFSDEDLTRYLSFTPLLDDDIIARKLNTASTTAQLNPTSVDDSIVAEATSKTASQTLIPLAKIHLLDLSSLEIKDELDSSQKSPNDEDLAQYLTAVP